MQETGVKDGHLGIDEEFTDRGGGGKVERGFAAGGDYCAEEHGMAGGAAFAYSGTRTMKEAGTPV